ncbi:MAG TPA: hypothetical protein VIV57_06555, partial [Anaeromyxobacter sp.]
MNASISRSRSTTSRTATDWTRPGGKAFQESFGAREAVGWRFGIGHREADDGLAQHAAQAGGLCSFGDDLFEVVHVGESRRAAEHHFQRGEARAGADEIGRDVAGFGGEDELLEPVLQAHVVGDAAKERHGGVGVGVD